LSSSLLLAPRPPRSPLVPYTTLFRSPLRLQVGNEEPEEPGVESSRESPHPRRGRAQIVRAGEREAGVGAADPRAAEPRLTFAQRDRKSTRLNSSHDQISYAVFCLKKK